MVAHHYDWFLVALSYLIAVFGAFTALKLTRQEVDAAGSEKWRGLGAASVAMGGGAIWSMHFIGMLAFDMGMPVAYDIPMTLLSLVVAIGVTFLGLYLAGSAPGSVPRLLAGGTIMGLGVAAMHYTGMAAMRMQATVTYDEPIRLLSVAIAVVAATAALWLVLRVKGSWQMVASALVMGLAVCGMHYTGMKAAVMKADSSLPLPAASALNQEVLAYVVFVVSLLMLSVGLILAGGGQVAQIRRVAPPTA